MQYRTSGRGKGRKVYPVHKTMRVHRKSYKRDGKRIPATDYVEDRPRSTGYKWYKHTADLHGWEHTQSKETRHQHLDEAAKAQGYAKTYHSLLGLSNVTEKENKVVSNTARADAKWFEEAHKEEVHESISREMKE